MGMMNASNVLKVLKIARAVGECNLKIFKASRVTLNQEMHVQVETIFYLLCTQNEMITSSLCFHSNFRIVLNNLFMHSSSTNQKRNILFSTYSNKIG